MAYSGRSEEELSMTEVIESSHKGTANRSTAYWFYVEPTGASCQLLISAPHMPDSSNSG